MKLVNIEVIKDELERLIRNYRFYSSTEAKYRCEAYKELSEWLDSLEVKEVDYERELSKYVSNGIHRFFPNVNDDYCKMDSVIWQDYVIETAKHFYELGLKAKGE